MHIDLNQDDAATLRDILQQRVRELDKEINATDSHRYKDALRESGRQLERILGAVTAAMTTPPTSGPADWEPRDNVADAELGHS